MNNKRKGRRFELETAREINRMYEDGTKAGPTFQSDASEQPDIDSKTLKAAKIHPECKNCKDYQPKAWLDQATRDCKDGEMPMVFHKLANDGRTIAVFFLSDLPKILPPNKGEPK